MSDLILPKRRILLFGNHGTGKSETADKLSKITNSSSFNTDKVRYNLDFSLIPYEFMVSSTMQFIRENNCWIIDYAGSEVDFDLFKKLAKEATSVIHLDTTKNDRMQGMVKKLDKAMVGIMPPGLTFNPDYASEGTHNLAKKIVELFEKKEPDMMRALKQCSVEKQTIGSYAELDEYINNF